MTQSDFRKYYNFNYEKPYFICENCGLWYNKKKIGELSYYFCPNCGKPSNNLLHNKKR